MSEGPYPSLEPYREANIREAKLEWVPMDEWEQLLFAAAVAVDPCNSPNEGWKGLVAAVQRIDPDWKISYMPDPPRPEGKHFARH